MSVSLLELVENGEVVVIEIGVAGPQGPPGTLIEVAENGAVAVTPLRTIDFQTGFDVSNPSERVAQVDLDLSTVAAGGELAGTLDVPTIDSLHSGSTHQSISDALNAHEIDVVGAHDASAVAFTPTGGIAAADTQSAIVEALTDARAYTDDGHVILSSRRGAVDGVAILDGTGKVPSSELPAFSLGKVFTVTSQAEMLALAASQGDMAVRTDSSQTFILSTPPASTLANWVELLNPGSPVTSVNTRIGSVTGLEEASNKGAVSGYAALDGSGYVPDGQIHPAIARDTEVSTALSTAEGYSDTNDASHAAAADPHTGYQKESEKAAASGYPSLDAGTKVPVAQLPTGTTGSTVALGDAAAAQITTHAGLADPHTVYGALAQAETWAENQTLAKNFYVMGPSPWVDVEKKYNLTLVTGTLSTPQAEANVDAMNAAISDNMGIAGGRILRLPEGIIRIATNPISYVTNTDTGALLDIRGNNRSGTQIVQQTANVDAMELGTTIGNFRSFRISDLKFRCSGVDASTGYGYNLKLTKAGYATISNCEFFTGKGVYVTDHSFDLVFDNVWWLNSMGFAMTLDLSSNAWIVNSIDGEDGGGFDISSGQLFIRSSTMRGFGDKVNTTGWDGRGKSCFIVHTNGLLDVRGCRMIANGSTGRGAEAIFLALDNGKAAFQGNHIEFNNEVLTEILSYDVMQGDDFVDFLGNEVYLGNATAPPVTKFAEPHSSNIINTHVSGNSFRIGTNRDMTFDDTLLRGDRNNFVADNTFYRGDV